MDGVADGLLASRRDVVDGGGEEVGGFVSIEDLSL